MLIGMALADGIELRHLAALRAVAAEQSFGRAAQRLGFTQSAISQQIAALERAVGAPVFDRPGGPKQVTLTPVGRLLLQHADELLDRLAVAESEVAALLEGREDHLTVGTFQSVSVKVLPDVIRRMRAERPGVEITLSEHDDVDALITRLVSGALDLSFIVLSYADDRVEIAWAVPDRFVLLAPAGAPPTPIAPTELAGVPLVGQHPTSCQLLIDDGLRGHGVQPNYVFRSNDNGAVQAMVRAGMGSAVMAYLAIDPTDPGVVVREFEPQIPHRVIALASRAGATMSPAARRFVEIAHDVCAQLLPC